MLQTKERNTTRVTNPFPGLRPFRFEETHLFFGREGQIEEVLHKLESNRFVAVLGASGSGKSSLMFCGLIPALYGGHMPQVGSNWNVVVSRPGVAPIDNLARQLVESESKNKKLSKEKKQLMVEYKSAILRSSSLGLVDLIKQSIVETDQKYLLLIDQFEEIFRFNREEDHNDAGNESTAFVKLLMAAINQLEVPIYVVMTMRSDYIGDCAQFPQLTVMINDSHYLIPQMTRAQKRAAILGPVAVGGATMSPRLVQQLLNDLGQGTDQLPVLQHALMRTWNFWTTNSSFDQPIDIYHYEAIGGMKEALSMHADESYEELTHQQKIICEILFKNLTEKGIDGRGIRRPTRLSIIAEIAEHSVEEIIEVIDTFRTKDRTFLTPSSEVAISESTVVDISHESLMRVWERCKDWVDEEAESVKTYLRLCEAAEMNQDGKSGLWRPPELQVAINWQKKQQPNLVWAKRYDSSFERAIAFLENSKKTYEGEQRSKERLQKRLLRRARVIAFTMALFVIFAIILVIWAQLERENAVLGAERAEAATQKAKQKEKEAQEQKVIAEKQKEIAQKQTILAEEKSLAAEKERARAQEALRAVEFEKQRAEVQKNIAEQQAKEAENQKKLAEEQQKLATANAARAKENAARAKENAEKAEKLRYLSIAEALAAKSISVKDTTQRALMARQAYLFNDEYDGHEFQPDIYEGLYYALKLLKGKDFNEMHHHKDMVKSIVAHNNDLYSVGSDGMLIRWTTSNFPYEPEMIFTENSVFRVLEISPDGELLAIGDDEGMVYVVSSRSKDIIYSNKVHDDRLVDIAFSNDSEYIFTLGLDDKIMKLDIRNSVKTEWIPFVNQAKTLIVTPDDKGLVTGHKKGKVMSWSLKDPSIPELFWFENDADITALQFSSNGKYLAGGYENGLIYLWDWKTGKEISELEGHDARINSLNFSRDDRFITSGSFDRTARVWEIDQILEPSMIMTDHESWVTNAVFSPDNRFLVTTQSSGVLKRFPLRPEEISDQICNSSLVRYGELTEKYWNKYIGKDIEQRVTCESKESE